MKNIFKNSVAKFIILLVIFSFGFMAPFYFSSGAAGIAYIVKEFGLDLVARVIARKLLTDLSNSVIKSVNNLGIENGQKAPTFVQDWKKFLADSQVIGENQFRAQLNYVVEKGVLCGDLKSPLASAFQVSHTPITNGNNIGQRDKYATLKQNTLIPFQTKMRCTVPDKTRAEFKKDFEKGGGWETWSRLLEPQNNLAGATLLSIEELQKQRASQEEAQKSEAVAGQGFEGVQGPCRGTGANALCTFLGKTVTPAKIMGNGAANFLDSESQWLLNSHELTEVLINMVGAVVNKLTDFSSKNQKNQDLTGGPVNQEAPDYLPAAQKDEQNLEQIKTNTEPTP